MTNVTCERSPINDFFKEDDSGKLLIRCGFLEACKHRRDSLLKAVAEVSKSSA